MDSYFEYECKPGKHIFATGSMAKDLGYFEADLLPGYIYFGYANQLIGGTYYVGGPIIMCPECDKEIWDDMALNIRNLNKITVMDLFDQFL